MQGERVKGFDHTSVTENGGESIGSTNLLESKAVEVCIYEDDACASRVWARPLNRWDVRVGDFSMRELIGLRREQATRIALLERCVNAVLFAVDTGETLSAEKPGCEALKQCRRVMEGEEYGFVNLSNSPLGQKRST